MSRPLLPESAYPKKYTPVEKTSLGVFWVCPTLEGGCGDEYDSLMEMPPEKDRPKCPSCGQPLKNFWSEHMTTVNFAMRGPGQSETKKGRKIRDELTKKNESMQDKQWEMIPESARELAGKYKNPTKGSPFDPNSRFHKKTAR